jgi:hypothetical protein
MKRREFIAGLGGAAVGCDRERPDTRSCRQRYRQQRAAGVVSVYRTGIV